MGGGPFRLGVLPIMGIGGCPFRLGVLPIMDTGGCPGRCPFLIRVLLIASKRVRPGRCPFAFPGSSSICYGVLAFCFLCFAGSSAYPAPVSCGHYAYCVPCKVQHKYVNFCMKVDKFAIV